MNPLQASAMFAACIWYTGRNEGAASSTTEAMTFARDNWSAFLPCAQEGLGRLLIRLASGRQQRRRRGRTATDAIAG